MAFGGSGDGLQRAVADRTVIIIRNDFNAYNACSTWSVPMRNCPMCYATWMRSMTRLGGHEIVGVSVRSPFVVRTPEPLDQVFGKTVGPFGRLGKRIVWSLEDDVHLVVPSWSQADSIGRALVPSLSERPICWPSTSSMAHS